ncbi:fibril-forming collagen alpha chain-like [Peromyscus leucopus]|uniref:fibril-forming collagen alpha chain-like n=1 Tax=Peromyscus leucopus TaxID=10041 RepID=UPI0018859AF4|nr:fibril-forming collagen alpha chain-like [Peromyscus leucopus]
MPVPPGPGTPGSLRNEQGDEGRVYQAPVAVAARRSIAAAPGQLASNFPPTTELAQALHCKRSLSGGRRLCSGLPLFSDFPGGSGGSVELARRGSGKAGHRPRPALRPGGALAGGALAPPPRPRALLCPRRAWVRGAAGRGVPAHRPPLPKRGRGRPDGPAGLGLTGCSPRRRAPGGRDPGGGNPAPAEALEAPRPYRWRAESARALLASPLLDPGRSRPPRSRARLADWSGLACGCRLLLRERALAEPRCSTTGLGTCQVIARAAEATRLTAPDRSLVD